MGIKSDEISSLIKQRIKEFDVPILAADVGIVTEVGDGIAQIYGLQNAQALELLEFKGGTSGMALNLEEDSVGAVILGSYEHIKEGDQVRTTGKIMQVPVGEARWPTRSSSPPPPATRRRSGTSPPTPPPRWANTSWPKARTCWSSTTISPSTPGHTGRSRCCCAGRRGARPIPVTSSICTRDCSSAPLG